jgi:hypothetical protein
MPFDFDGESWPRWAGLLQSACDVVIIANTGDKGSNMLPVFRHFSKVSEDLAGSLSDIDACELHVLQAVKNATWVVVWGVCFVVASAVQSL